MGVREDKESAVAEITHRFNEAEGALLTEYRGLRVAEIAELRTALRAADAEYKVLKNTLARIAVREVGLEELVDQLVGPTAIVFANGDVAAAAKALDDAAKQFPVLVVKGGALKGGKTFDAAQAKALASIEPREVLLAKIAMLANSPAQQMANVLSALLRNFGSMLAQVVEKKEAGETFGSAPAAVAPSDATPRPTEDPAEGGETADEGAETPAPTQDPAEGADDSSAEATASVTGGEAAASEPEVAETEAEEPPVAPTEQPDPAEEAAEEASAGTADIDEDKA